MQVNTNTQVGIDVLKQAIDTNKTQVSKLLATEQHTKAQMQTQSHDTVPKSNVVGSLFDKKV